MLKKSINLLSLLFVLVCAVQAQAPTGYYSAADGAKGASLKTALFNIIKNHDNIGYDGLWNAYKTTDRRPDGKLWDMYSNKTNYDIGGSAQGKNYKQEGDAYNREHSVPQSWFNEASPMKADVFHVYPTDGYVNNRRSNYPFGENAGEEYKSNGGFCKLGKCTTPGYSGRVFEPADEYKGDFARSYFYMATCYEDKINGWDGVFGCGKYPGIADWSLKMFLRWAEQDPVSQKEIDRNNAAYKLQKNRNPFIDYPGLEQYVWGTKTGTAFSVTAYVNPFDGTQGGGGEGGDDGGEGTGGEGTGGGDDGGGGTIDPVIPPVQGENEYVLLTSASQLVDGASILVVCGEKSVALAERGTDIRGYAEVSISDGKITTETGRSGKPYALTLGASGSHYTLYDSVEKGYLGLTGSANKLHMLETATDEALWNISIKSSGEATIQSNARSNYWIQYNSGAPRFCCYKSAQTAVQIYQGNVPSHGGDETGISSPRTTSSSAVLYDVQGRAVKGNATRGGLYILNGKKILR